MHGQGRAISQDFGNYLKSRKKNVAKNRKQKIGNSVTNSENDILSQ